MNTNSVILSTAYLPPIQYIAKLIGYNDITVEVFDTYAKQSYRNRCVILSCNGPLSLTIPVIRKDGNHTLTKDVKIDYTTNWQKNHWKAIESAYRTSAYYDFVADAIAPFYRKKEVFLIDFNALLLSEVLQFIGIDKLVKQSHEFTKDYSDVADFRSSIHPKPQYQSDDSEFEPYGYYQVYGERFSFIPNLSVVDLLFNEGLNSLEIIKSSMKK